MRHVIFLFMLFITAYSVGTIPDYEIESIQDGIITLTNDAAFKIQYKDGIRLSTWSVGDLLVLTDSQDHLRRSPGKVKDGGLILNPHLHFRNISKNNAQVGVRLEIPPVISGSDTFAVVHIDVGTRIIMLDDGSQWTYTAKYDGVASRWLNNELVMVGEDTAPFSAAEEILFNTDRLSVIPVTNLVP